MRRWSKWSHLVERGIIGGTGLRSFAISFGGMVEWWFACRSYPAALSVAIVGIYTVASRGTTVRVDVDVCFSELVATAMLALFILVGWACVLFIDKSRSAPRGLLVFE